MKKITVNDIAGMKAEGRKIPVLTAYSYQIAALVDSSGVPVLMVGDSVGMVEAGYDTTLPVTVDEMIYHTRSVARARTRALVVTDMPFMSYQADVSEAVRNAGRLVKEGCAEAVKLEGGESFAGTVSAIVQSGIPVMGHIGLTPQSVHAMGGYRVQGKDPGGAERLKNDALAIERAGAFSLVLEGVPAELAGEITASLSIPTIGIGAGPGCDGQVLVINDMLGLTPEGRTPKFVKRYAELGRAVKDAVAEYVREVEEESFPDEGHSY